jgi:hypothetical protein
MRKMKGSSNYLRNQVRKNLAKAVLCILLFFLIFSFVGLTVLFSLSFTLLDATWLLVSLVPLGASYFYLRRYRIYGGGLAGEKQVAKLLSGTLSDDYWLINSLYLHNGGGDIDHVVLGPGGIFVLETKNWSGTISCNGDEWQRAGRGNFKGSPSQQVKRNTAAIKNIIDSSPFRSLGISVEGIVVFTNNHATLHINNPAVPILRLSQLANYITTHGNAGRYSSQQLEEIGKEILKR